MIIKDNKKDYVILWEQPKLEPPEFRLYYDDNGKVLSYSGDKSGTGNYIVIDAITFAAARPDIRVIDNKISTVASNAVVYKLMPNNIEGIDCHPDDVSIVVDNTYTNRTQKWKLITYEL
jgi:hypothetical protein